MSTEKSTLGERITETDVLPRAKYLIVSYPAITLSLFFVVPLLLLVVVSTFQNIEGGFFQPAFTLENYVRFIGSDLFQQSVLINKNFKLGTNLQIVLQSELKSVFKFRLFAYK